MRFHNCFDHIEQRACYCPGGQGNNRGSSSHLFHLFSVHSRVNYNHVCVQLCTNDFGNNHKGNVSINTYLGILKKEHNNPYGSTIII